MRRLCSSMNWRTSETCDVKQDWIAAASSSFSGPLGVDFTSGTAAWHSTAERHQTGSGQKQPGTAQRHQTGLGHSSLA